LDHLFHELQGQSRPPPGPPFDEVAYRGDDGNMGQRLRAIEDLLLAFETRADRFATRDDVRAIDASLSRIEASFHRELHAQAWKIIGVVAVLFSGAQALARICHA
jgi:hypothetical protein